MTGQFDFRAVLIKIQDLLSDSDRHRLHFLLGEDVPKYLRDDPSLCGTLRVLESLFEKAIISDQDCDYLIDAFKKIRCNDAAKRLQEYQRVRNQTNQQNISSLQDILLQDNEEDKLSTARIMDDISDPRPILDQTTSLIDGKQQSKQINFSQPTLKKPKEHIHKSRWIDRMIRRPLNNRECILIIITTVSLLTLSLIIILWRKCAQRTTKTCPDKHSISEAFDEKDIKWFDSWAFSCDFYDNDLTNIQISGERCGGICAQTPGCSHFSWTKYKDGTCWLKKGQISKIQAKKNNDKSMVCGIIDPSRSSSSVEPILSNIFATRYLDKNSATCALPASNYSIDNTVALGNIEALKHLKFRPELCGHILTINCGNGPLDAIITNSMSEGGLHLYDSTWKKLTNNKPFGNTSCTVQLAFRNIFNSPEPRCYYKSGTNLNATRYYKVGILNTYGRIVSKATIDTQIGQHRDTNTSYAFDFDLINPRQQVIFMFEDETINSFLLEECIYQLREQIWH